MTKKELVSQISVNVGFTQTDIKCVVDEMLRLIESTTANDEKVYLVGFGTFQPVRRKARMLNNINTGTQMAVDAKTAVKFKAAKEYKELLNS